MADETVNVTNSRVLPSERQKRLCDDTDDLATPPPKFPLLESVAHRFEHNRKEQQERLACQKTRQETEKVHARYLKDNLDCSTQELLQAESAATYWANRHGVKDNRLTSRRRASPVRRRTNRAPSSSSLNNQSKDTSSASSQPMSSSASSTGSRPKPAARAEENKPDLGNSPFRSRSDSLIILNSEPSSPTAAADQSSGNTTATVIDLDVTGNDSLILVSDDTIHSPVLDLSNNAGGATTKAKTSKKATATASQDERRHRCAVLNCEAEFSTEGALGQHLNLFQHSPCNPRLKATNCKLAPDPLFYMCPDCDMEFQTLDDCSAHMKAERHSPYYPPLSVAGYMCAQCLYVFGDFRECWNHIEDSAHKDICYPFADDLAAHVTGVGPVAVIQELVEDLSRRCRDLPWHVQCLECTLEVEDPAELRQHGLETNNTHLLSALCDSSLVDVFAGYIAGYSCDKCHRLFNGDLKLGAKHDCAKGVMGTIIENDTNSFFDFIKRCALSLIKSLDTGEGRHEPRPGPSRCSRETSRERRSKTLPEKATNKASLEKATNKASPEKATNKASPEKATNKASPGKATTRFSSPKRNHVEVISSDEDVDEDCILVSDTGGSKTRDPSTSKGTKKRKSRFEDISADTSAETLSRENTAPLTNNSTDDVWERLNGITSASNSQTANRTTTGTQPASTSQGATGYQSTSQGATGYQSTSQGATGNQSTSQGATGNQSTSQGATGNQSTSQGATGNKPASTSQGATGYQSTSQGATGYQSTSQGATGNQSTTQGATGYQSTSQGATGYQSTSQGATGYQPTSQRATGIHNFQPFQPNVPPPFYHQQNRYIPPLLPLATGLGLPCSSQSMGNMPLQPFTHPVVHRQMETRMSSYGASRGSYNYNYRGKQGYNNRDRRSPVDRQMANSAPVRERSRSPLETALISVDNLSRMTNIIFLDLDNWKSFFTRLPRVLSDRTFCWGFYGGNQIWYEPRNCHVFKKMKDNGQFYLNERCGNTKDAADFAIVLTVGKMDARLPSSVAFTILSGDTGFLEVERLMGDSERKAVVINPHRAEKFSNEMIYTMVTSVSDT